MEEQVKDSAPVTEGDAPKDASSDVFEAKETVEVQAQPKEDAKVEAPRADKRVPLQELQKERQRRRQAEDENLRMRQKLDDIEGKVSSMAGVKDEEDLILEAERDLGLDKDLARKLVKFNKKVLEKSTPTHQPNGNGDNDPINSVVENFRQRAIKVSVYYDDWKDMMPAMQMVMAHEIEQDGIEAYYKSPEYYYSKALKAQIESNSTVKKELSVDRANNTSLAATETGGGTARPKESKITQAALESNRSNIKWVRENAEEIRQLMQQGKLK